MKIKTYGSYFLIELDQWEHCIVTTKNAKRDFHFQADRSLDMIAKVLPKPDSYSNIDYQKHIFRTRDS